MADSFQKHFKGQQMFSSFFTYSFGSLRDIFPTSSIVVTTEISPQFLLYFFSANLKQQRIKVLQDLEFSTNTKEFSTITALSHFSPWGVGGKRLALEH